MIWIKYKKKANIAKRLKQQRFVLIRNENWISQPYLLGKYLNPLFPCFLENKYNLLISHIN